MSLTTPISIDPEVVVVVASERTETSDVIVGICMIFASVVCAVAYSFILTGIANDRELIRMTSYKFMFFIGVADVIQCFPHTVTGFFTIFQSTWGPVWPKIMGVLATPFYVAYAILTIILALNRFVQLASPHWDRRLFSPGGTICLLGFAGFWCLLYMLALSSPWASIIYFPEAYSWDYDYTLEYSWVVQKVEMVIEVGGIFLAAFFYAGVLIILCKTRRRFKSSKNARVELKILIQALVITVYCTVLNVFWHNYQILLPDSLWSYMGLNFMWILNSGIYPIIYFVVNKTIRDKVKNRNVTRIERSVAPGITNGKFATAVMRTAQMPKPSASASCTESTKPSQLKPSWQKQLRRAFSERTPKTSAVFTT